MLMTALQVVLLVLSCWIIDYCQTSWSQCETWTVDLYARACA